MKRTWRVLLAGFVTGVAVLASAGAAEAGSVHENEPADYCEECAEPCEDPALNSIPGLGAIPVVSPSESGCDE